IPIVEVDEYEKDYTIDNVASELLGDVTVWLNDSHALKSLSQEYVELENLKSDQVKQTERLEAIEKLEKEILDRLTAAHSASSAIALHPSGFSKPDVPASLPIATNPEKQVKKRYKKTQL
ncbi:hypothetical protein TorRG33x02_036830, partial [Trema orientale]